MQPPQENATGYIWGGTLYRQEVSLKAEVSSWHDETKLTTRYTWGFRCPCPATISPHLPLSLHSYFVELQLNIFSDYLPTINILFTGLVWEKQTNKTKTLFEWCAKVFIYNLRTRVLISSSFLVTFKCTRQPRWPFGPQLQSWVTLVTVLALAAKPSHWKAATALATPAYELFPIESNLMLGCSKSKIYAAQEIP